MASSVFVGSEPNKLALSDNGTTLYTTLEGAFAIRQFNAQTQVPGLQFPVGQDSFFGLYTVNDIVVSPGEPNVIALARYFRGTSPPEAGVAIFDNGVQRTKTGPGHIAGSDFVAYSATPTKLYGSGTFDSNLRVMTIDGTGVAQVQTIQANIGAAPLIFQNGLLFSATGQVYNPDTQTTLGRFFNVNSNAFTVDSALNRAYFLVQESNNWTIKAFDISTFLQVGSLVVPNVVGTPTRLVRWGSNGLAFRTGSGQLFIVQTSLVPSGDPIPTPTPTPSPSPSPTPFATFVQTVPLASNDLVYSSNAQKLFASIPSRIGTGGNSITAVDPVSGALGTPVFVGSEPNRLALSEDTQSLYVGLDGSAAVSVLMCRPKLQVYSFQLVKPLEALLYSRKILLFCLEARTQLRSRGPALLGARVRMAWQSTTTAFDELR